VKVLLIVLAAVALGTLAWIAAQALVRTSPAAVVREDRAITGFDRIDISGAADVTLVQGDTEGIAIEAPARIVSRVRTSVHDRRLIVETSTPWHWRQLFESDSRNREPRLTIHVRRLERIDAAGTVKLAANTLTADSLVLDLAGACAIKIAELRANELRLDGSGAIKVELAGKVDSQHIDISGAGSYQAAGLASQKTVLHVSGAAKAVVNAAVALAVDISGAGVVEYIGDPKLEQTISGVGKVRRRGS
jgi:hypothetical protein